MKKLYILSALLLLTTFSFAQTFNWGIKAGVNVSTISGITSATGFGSNLTGFNAGAIANLDFPNFTIQQGLFYSTKGNMSTYSTISANQQTINTYATGDRLGYLEMPVNFLYNIVHLPGGNIHLGAGPYIGYGFSETLSGVGPTETFTFGNFYYRNPDYGVNFIVGTKLRKHFLVDAQYGLGIANLAHNGETLHNRVLSISAGYLFR
jgi:Outer membrane protein beta-barrel domain